MAQKHAFVRETHERAALMKLMNVKRDDAGATGRFVVEASRGSQHVATFFPTTTDATVQAVRLAVSAFGCDLVACSVDADQPLADRQPGDQPVELDLRGGPGLSRPRSAALTTHAVDRVEQQVFTIEQPYQVQGRRIVWDPLRGPFTDGQGYRASGAVAQALRESLSGPDVLAQLQHRLQLQPGPAGGPLSTGERRAYTDVAALRVCAQLAIPVMYDVADPELRDTVQALLSLDAR